MRVNNFPFHIGATPHPSNPVGLPDTWPFALEFDPVSVLIKQAVTAELLEILDKVYRRGALFGTPLDGDRFGKPYADDFLNFVHSFAIPDGRSALEIGAGVGYLTKCLQQSGWSAIGIEPGRIYAEHWIRNNATIVNDYFPTDQVLGEFPLICSYGVLEHMTDPIKFLSDIRNQLSSDGVAVFSVPDCTDELAAGDPSILFHEHFSYFDAGSLKRLISSAGMHSGVIKSGFGRCLYAVASKREIHPLPATRQLSDELIASYPQRCAETIGRIKTRIQEITLSSTLGVYCAVRALPYLDVDITSRFFDDDPALHGKYLPPYRGAIEGRESLFANPVDCLIVMSRTFGDRIRNSLLKDGYTGKILMIDEL